MGETGVVSLCEGFEGRLGRWRDKGAALVIGRLIGTRAYLGLLLVGIVINRDGRTVDVNSGGKATGDSGGEAVNGDLIVGEILVAWRVMSLQSPLGAGIIRLKTWSAVSAILGRWISSLRKMVLAVLLQG